MKVKLFHKLLNNSVFSYYAKNIMENTDFFASIRENRFSIERKHRIIRNLWFNEYNPNTYIFRKEFEYMYRHYSRKYWTPEAKLRRMIITGKEID